MRKLGSTRISLRIEPSHILLALAGSVVLVGCDATKRVPEGERLLIRNGVHVDSKSVDPSELEAIIKQRSNKRVLGFPFYLHLWNLRDPEHVAMKRARKDSLCHLDNLERETRGRKPKTCNHATKDRSGEPPVLLDSILTSRTAEQMRLYMQKEGWFHATVKDSTHFRRRRLWGGRGRPYRQPKADVMYTIEPGPVTRYRNIKYSVDDPAINDYVQRSWEQSLLKPGDRFDADVLENERVRITDRLKELGYLYFSKDLIQFTADTTIGEDLVDITLIMERPYGRNKRGLQGTPEGSVFSIKDVTIATMRSSRKAWSLTPDTLDHKGYRFLYEDVPPYKPDALLSAVFLQPDSRYRKSEADRTYRRLTSLRVFDRVELSYDTTGLSLAKMANVRIDVLPGKIQSMTFEAYGTNRGGFLGTSLSLGYKHRNLFRGMGSIQAQMVLGLEAQQSFTGAGASTTEGTSGGAASDLFNTIEIGPEVTLRFPTFLLPISRDRIAKSAIPSTTVIMAYNLQQRPDYTRTLIRTSFGYEWQETRTKTWGFFPLDINLVRIPSKSPEFEDYLESANDPVLTDSYTDHLIAGMRGQFLYNSQLLARQRNSFFSRITLEWAGHPLFVPLTALGTEVTDSTGSTYRTIGDIRFAEFVKMDSDLRWRHVIHEKSSLAFRVAAGVGVPYGNLGVLPFESSFFVGGANGLRAWRARSIGPGAYAAPLLAFDRIGEMRLEGNAEYRFKLIGYLEGAFFADVGNIWLLEEDPQKPGSGFSSTFLSELAIGTGIGARLNFDFFIVRFDLGMQTKDPSLPPGERWLFEPKDQYLADLSEQTGQPATYRTQFNFNLGIGYPF